MAVFKVFRGCFETIKNEPGGIFLIGEKAALPGNRDNHTKVFEAINRLINESPNMQIINQGCKYFVEIQSISREILLMQIVNHSLTDQGY